MVLWDNELLFEQDFKYRSNRGKDKTAKNSIVIKAGETTSVRCNEPINPQLIIQYRNKVSFPPDVKLLNFKPYNFSVSHHKINNH